MRIKLKLLDFRRSRQLKYSKALVAVFFGIMMQFITTSNVEAQTSDKYKLTGKVYDSEGPLPGATVQVKGTNHGTFSDAEGNFSIEVAKDDVLIISFIGFKTKEVSVASRSSVEVSLEEDVSSLNEVVVVGYGTTKRADVTGAISSIKSEDIALVQPTTFEQALQGRVPGVVIQQTSGQPGGGVSVQIRGITSFSGGSPLYVVDGIVVSGAMGGPASLGNNNNPLAGINPAEIESIDVLKDASASAIYGSQATNGVIIITTKRGKVAPPKITYDVYAGYQQLYRKLPLMNLQEYATFINERNEGIGWGFDERPEFANPEYLGEGTDWQDELFRDAPMASHTLSISGGDSRTQYMLSGSYFEQEGIALGSKFDRTSLRLNLDNQTTDWLKMGTSLQLVGIKENVNSTSSNVISTALSQTPDIPVRNPDGSWGGAFNENGWVNRTVNPYAIALINKDKISRKQMFANLYAEITPLEGLVLRNEATGNFSIATQERFFPTYEMGLVEKTVNEGSFDFRQSNLTTLRNYLTYTRLFAEKYSITVMGGHEAQLNKSMAASASRSNFPSNDVQTISAGDPTTAKNSETKGHNSLESYFGRLNFGFNDKYLLTGNIRYDGSSKFAKENQWVLSYSGALAWKMQNENFLKGIKQVNELKLRVGYGLTNNPAGRDYTYASVLATVPTGISPIAQITTKIGNPDFKWEQTKYANIGLDGTLFNWRINFSVDFYDRQTDDLAMQAALPFYSGTSIGWAPGAQDAPWVNIGSVSNKGFDFRISSTNVQGEKFMWKTDLTVSRNINKVLKLNTDGAALVSGYTGYNQSYSTRTVEGGSMGEFYGYQVDGVFATASDFETHARPTRNGEELGIAPESGSVWYGDLMFKDINGDGIIDEKDQTFLGSPIPKYQIGLNNMFSYKNFDLTIFLSASIGHKVFNTLRIQGENPNTSFGYLKALENHANLALVDSAGSASDINNVYVTNPDTDIPGVRNDNSNGNNRTSDKFIEDGSFIRCKTISLGYTFSDKLLQKLHISSFRVYANVSNAFLITKYKGMDPEIGSWDPLSAGIDSGFYPQPRVFTLGANITLSK